MRINALRTVHICADLTEYPWTMPLKFGHSELFRCKHQLLACPCRPLCIAIATYKSHQLFSDFVQKIILSILHPIRCTCNLCLMPMSTQSSNVLFSPKWKCPIAASFELSGERNSKLARPRQTTPARRLSPSAPARPATPSPATACRPIPATDGSPQEP